MCAFKYIPHPFVTWIGDSISTVGHGDPPAYYTATTGKLVNNYAIGGQGFVFNGPQIQTQYTGGSELDVEKVIVAGGINDLVNGVQAATLATAVFTFVDARLAESKTVVLNNDAPCRGYSGCSTILGQLAAYNAAVATGCAARPSLICVDLYTLWDDGHGYLNPLYDSGDGLHENAAGAQVWGEYVAGVAP